jgi:Dolichyl-phosphate-mannose-protein mannosyltransferase
MDGSLHLHIERLRRNCATACDSLRVPLVAVRVVLLLLMIHSCLLAYSAYVHSPTLNEPGHLVAGLSYWKFRRFDIYRVNPPLVRLIAALPVLVAGYNEDWSAFYDGPGARPEVGLGTDFVTANGTRSNFLFMLARWACIPFSWIGGTICYLWARDLYGRVSGIVACAIWCFEPNILAHASLITVDAAATSLSITACYAFWRWLRRPTWTRALLAGAALGLAELTKTTLILFYALWPFVWIVYRLADRRQILPRVWRREAGMLILQIMFGIYIVNVGYGFEGSFCPLKEFDFCSKLLTSQWTDQGSVTESQGDAITPRNRFVGSWLGTIPVPLPKDYVLGIDTQQKDVETRKGRVFIAGSFREHGSWYYYLYAAAIKVPLGLLGLGVLTLVWTMIRAVKCRGPANDPDLTATDSDSSASCLAAIGSTDDGWREHIALLSPGVAILLLLGWKGASAEHFRYALPAFPFFFIATAQSAQLIGGGRTIRNGSAFLPRRKLATAITNCIASIAPMFCVFLLSWAVISSLWIYPHSLSFFNESIGGPINGPSHLRGSSIDWGQDLVYLAEYCDRTRKPIRVAYNGGFDPIAANMLSIANILPFSTLGGVGADERIGPGFYAISVGLLQDESVSPRGIMTPMDQLDPKLMARLRGARVVARTGYSIEVLHVDDGTVAE